MVTVQSDPLPVSRQDTNETKSGKTELVEDVGDSELAHKSTYIPTEAIAQLSQEHRDYLFQRHGTLDLDPVPAFGSADPYNWPTWKKVSNLVLVAIHASTCAMTAAAIIPATEVIALDLNVSLQRATYLTSLQIAFLGASPLFWRPLANKLGRRPMFLLSLLCSLIGNVGCAVSHSYATMALCRAIVGFFISPPGAIGSGVVTETFFRHERARYMGIWTVLLGIGVPIGPFIFGFVVEPLGYRWIFWMLAIFNGIQLILYIFLGPETRYIRKGVEHQGSDFKQEYLNLFSRIDPTPFTFWEFVEPLALFAKPCALLPAIASAMVFLFGSVLTSVELPQLFIEKFGLTPPQLGLQFMSIIIGSIIGEVLSGPLSDFWMNRATRRKGQRPPPEYRLWLSYPGIIITIVGMVVFLVQTDNAAEGQWNITPVIGIAIAAAGTQIVTTILITYVVDCYHDEAPSVGVFMISTRLIWGFIGPFWFPDMFTNVGIGNSAGVAAALLVVAGIVPTAVVQWKGRIWRGDS